MAARYGVFPIRIRGQPTWGDSATWGLGVASNWDGLFATTSAGLSVIKGKRQITFSCSHLLINVMHAISSFVYVGYVRIMIFLMPTVYMCTIFLFSHKKEPRDDIYSVENM
jgi:hypothetical protein